MTTLNRANRAEKHLLSIYIAVCLSVRLSGSVLASTDKRLHSTETSQQQGMQFHSFRSGGQSPSPTEDDVGQRRAVEGCRKGGASDAYTAIVSMVPEHDRTVDTDDQNALQPEAMGRPQLRRHEPEPDYTSSALNELNER